MENFSKIIESWKSIMLEDVTYHPVTQVKLQKLYKNGPIHAMQYPNA